jgi:putative endonuclease
MPYTYILQCADGSLYTGWTTDLEKRIVAHNSGNGARYTRGRVPVSLVYWEVQPTRSMAQRREENIKRLERRKKDELIAQFSVEQLQQKTP